MKVHELAKKLNMQSKELVEKLIELKYDVKSHLSIIEEEDVEKIIKKLGGGLDTSKKETQKKEKKPISPVIIRREVTRIEESKEDKKQDISPLNQDGLRSCSKKNRYFYEYKI